jgi:hypothetical protein
LNEPSSRTSCVRPDRIGPTGLGPTRLEDSSEARLHLDDLLEHDVGLVETALRPGTLVVVDLHHQRRALGDGRVGDRQPVSGYTGTGATVVAG